MEGAQPGRQDSFSLEPRLAGLLAQAERRLGQLEMLARLWPSWPELVGGPLLARAAALEADFQGRPVELAELLFLGPQPRPTRPDKALRGAVGVLLAWTRLNRLPLDEPLTPSLVSEILSGLTAPWLARGTRRQAEWSPGDAPVPGAAAWSLAPGWVRAGLPALMAAGLACAAWEREGPEHPQRGAAGRVLLMGLAPRLGLPVAACAGLGQGLQEAAAALPGGLEAVLAEVRAGGAWKPWLGVFLSAMAKAAQDTLDKAVAIHTLTQEHHALVKTWARAPRHPVRFLNLLLERPVLELPEVAARLEVTQRTAGLLAAKLKELGLLSEITGQRRGRRFAYRELVEILSA